jgi:hypothetical protein
MATRKSSKSSKSGPVLGVIQGGPSRGERLDLTRRHNPFRAVSERGVYDAVYLGPNGGDMMISITHDGRRLSEVEVVKESERDALYQRLRAELDSVDPVPGRISPSLVS